MIKISISNVFTNVRAYTVRQKSVSENFILVSHLTKADKVGFACQKLHTESLSRSQQLNHLIQNPGKKLDGVVPRNLFT